MLSKSWYLDASPGKLNSQDTIWLGETLLVVRRKAFFGAIGLAVFITVCVYGLDGTLPYWLYAVVFAISAYAIFGFTGKLSVQENSPAADSDEPADETAKP